MEEGYWACVLWAWRADILGIYVNAPRRSIFKGDTLITRWETWNDSKLISDYHDWWSEENQSSWRRDQV